MEIFTQFSDNKPCVGICQYLKMKNKEKSRIPSRGIQSQSIDDEDFDTMGRNQINVSSFNMPMNNSSVFDIRNLSILYPIHCRWKMNRIQITNIAPNGLEDLDLVRILALFLSTLSTCTKHNSLTSPGRLLNIKVIHFTL